MRNVQTVDARETHTPKPFEYASGDELLTVPEAARLLHVTVSWVYEHTRDAADDRLPVLRIGKYLRFDRRDLVAYVEAKRSVTHGVRRRR
jgi:excisionase family DNA binding protein